jgi:hypothetical protein
MLAAAAFGAGPALAAGPAVAATPSVEFSGGSVLNVLVCRSQPSSAKVTVPAEARVTFVNRLGQPASLHVDGKTVSSVGANQAVPVVFHYGPVNVSMSISCDVGVVEEFGAVTVAVTPKPAPAAPAPVATGPVAANHAGTATPTGQGSRAAARSSATPAAATPAAVDPDAAAVDPWAPPAGLAASGVSSPDPGTGEHGSNEAASAADVGTPVAASGTPVHAASGLLAMIATVLTIGVGVAAVRSAFARRTSRSAFA